MRAARLQFHLLGRYVAVLAVASSMLLSHSVFAQAAPDESTPGYDENFGLPEDPFENNPNPESPLRPSDGAPAGGSDGGKPIFDTVEEVRSKLLTERRTPSGMSDGLSVLENMGADLKNTEGAAITPGIRAVNVTTYEPSSGIRGNMWGGDFKEKGNKDLKSPRAIMNITWGLTEPGVAMGMQQALVQASMVSQQQMIAEQLFFAQLSQFPELREPMAQAYIACVAKLSGKTERVANSEFTGGWAEAVRVCMKNLNFAHDEAAMGWSGQNGGSVSDEHTTYLSNYIFTPEVLNRARGQSGAAVNNADSIEYLRGLQVAFQKYIGDLRFTFGKPITDEDDTDAHEVAVQKVAPLEMSPEAFITTVRLPQVYGELFTTLFEYCNFRKGAEAKSATPRADVLNFYESSSFTKEEVLKKYQDRSFIDNPERFPKARRYALSTSTRQFDHDTLEDLYSLVDGQACTALNPSVSEFAYKLEDIQKSRSLSAAQQALYTYSLAVARGRVYQVLVDMDSLIGNLTMGTFNDSFVKPRAVQLLNEAVPGGVIQALNTVDGVLRQLMAEVRSKRAQRTGGNVFLDQAIKRDGGGDRMNSSGMQ